MKKEYRVANYFAFTFMLFPATWILFQLYIFDKNNHPIEFQLRSLASIFGQFFVFIGIYVTAISAVSFKRTKIHNVIIWSIIHSFGWLILYHIGWCAFFSIKFMENHFIFPKIRILDKLALWWLVFFIYTFIEFAVITKRLEQMKS